MKQLILKQNNPLLYSLTGGNLILNPLWQRKTYRYKFLLRSTLIYPQSLKWLKKLSEYPSVRLFLARQTNLPCKLHRPYLSAAMRTVNVYQALTYHYNFLTFRLPEDLCRKLYSHEQHTLAKITGKNEQEFFIKINSEDRYSREGELTLFFYNTEQLPLARLTFSFVNYENKSTLFIGGLQGSESNVPHKHIQTATKACYGLFPKRILLEVAGYLAQHYAIEQIVAVGNKTHVYNNWRYARKLSRLHADYDSFWTSLGAQQDKKQHFNLPVELPRKPIEDVVSKKRAEYSRRYALMDELKRQTLLSIS